MKKYFFFILVFVSPIILFSQNVGVGTPTPLKKIHIQSGGISVLNSGFGDGILFSTDSNSGARIYLENLQGEFDQKSMVLVNENVDGQGTTYFGSLSDDGSVWIKNVILSMTHISGNVGIGTLSPSELLHVNGNLKVAGIISGVTDPVSAQDAATKNYVDLSTELPANPSTGELMYFDGTSWVLLAPGTDGQHLELNSGVPSWIDTPCDLYIGQFYKGGYIFYLDTTGCHGLIAAPVDQGTNKVWGCSTTFIDETSDEIGTGQANTTAIVNGCAESGFAARLCDDLVYGGYKDWFLPSKDELDLMWENLANSDENGDNSGPSDPNNLGGFSSGVYWSSTESSNNSAWRQNFGNGGQFTVSKNAFVTVRAVRAF